MRSNCLLWAVRQWWAQGGYVLATKSRYGWWPHFLWSSDLETFYAWTAERWHYEQFRGRPWWRRWVPPLLFDGFVREIRPFVQRHDAA